MPSLAEGAAIVYLDGDLGSGKTTLARGVLRASGIAGTVRSPTYTLLERYEAGELIVVHLDLYRVVEAAELEALGLRELHRAQHLWLIEWPHRGAGRLPPADLVVGFEAGPDCHHLRVSPHSALGEIWLASFEGS
jgi:tRNA threonylcarbamoyladenosine biosynthesis protein TsaE